MSASILVTKVKVSILMEKSLLDSYHMHAADSVAGKGIMEDMYISYISKVYVYIPDSTIMFFIVNSLGPIADISVMGVPISLWEFIWGI